jgi:hypothetical protein
MKQFHICEYDEGKECGKYQQECNHAPECRPRYGYAVLVAADILVRLFAFLANPRYGIVGNDMALSIEVYFA